ncbi:hypothetical protein RUM43_009419 [Polyplax serrata]|uniref:RNase NYN domain-containing protein n=1 Tax=Polyplax serrata TaxID=468196 RepID=A0AAN8S8I9_POLSC
MGKRRNNSLTECHLRKTIAPKREIKRRRRFKRRMRSLNNSHLIQEISYEINKKPSPSKNKFENKKDTNSTIDVIVLPDECELPRTQSLNKTIDLCADDSYDNVQNTQRNISSNPQVFIDLSKEPSEEVIVVDENLQQKPKCCDNGEAVVVDLNENDEAQGKENDRCDDIVVIGSFHKNPFSTSTSSKINSLIRECIQLKNKPSKIRNQKLNLNWIGNKNSSKKINTSKSEHKKAQVMPETSSSLGENIYTNSPVDIPKHGLRPIIIDGSNVALGTNIKKRIFSCKHLEICIKYFKERGHKVTAFVPQFRTLHGKSDNPNLLNRLADMGDVILTPSKRVEGRSIVPYDDRFIVQTAVLQGGIIVTRDNYRDLLQENPAWAETINYRTLPYTWVGDILMFPKDPLGEHGPTLDEFLRFN